MLHTTKRNCQQIQGINTFIGLDDASTIANISSFTEKRQEIQNRITEIAFFLIVKFDPPGNFINPDTPE
jgi:hypothetical protein